jgi:prolycopene isomerase
MQAMHDRLARAFTDQGGELRLNTLVTKINIDSSRCRANGVTTDQGEFIAGDTVVWAADYKALITDVLGPGHFPQRTRERLLGAKLTEGLVSAYLGLDMTDEELGDILGGAQHPFYFPNYDVIFPDASSPSNVHQNMWIALNHFGKESPSAPPGKSTLTLQTFSAFDWENHWHNGGVSLKRTDRYRELKQEVGMQLVELAENLVPGLRDRVEYMDVGTPISLYRFSRNTDGSSGGWCYDDQVSPVWTLGGLNRIKTPIPNVFCSGHYALWPGGVISAALCGRIVGNMVSGKRGLSPLIP